MWNENGNSNTTSSFLLSPLNGNLPTQTIFLSYRFRYACLESFTYIIQDVRGQQSVFLEQCSIYLFSNRPVTILTLMIWLVFPRNDIFCWNSSQNRTDSWELSLLKELIFIHLCSNKIYSIEERIELVATYYLNDEYAKALLQTARPVSH